MSMKKTNPKATNKSGWGSRQIALGGLMTAVICVLSPWSLHITGLVPISLGLLAVYFVTYVMGMKWGTISIVVYLLLGAMGLPVFTDFSGGIGKVLGPTGGYLVGYVLIGLIAGFFLKKWPDKTALHFLGMVLGTAACYLLGALWLLFQTQMSLPAIFMAYVLPFIPGDLVKMILAIALGNIVRKRLQATNLL